VFGFTTIAVDRSTDLLLQRAKALRLNGLAENWQTLQEFTWVKQLIE
jgi:hypothetical protein